jgi:hypothetical protein
VISRGDGRVEVSLESPASAGLFRFRPPRRRAVFATTTFAGRARRNIALAMPTIARLRR